VPAEVAVLRQFVGDAVVPWPAWLGWVCSSGVKVALSGGDLALARPRCHGGTVGGVGLR
jgi:uncharacterized membrane protein